MILRSEALATPRRDEVLLRVLEKDAYVQLLTSVTKQYKVLTELVIS